jgi:hypothetical protein
MVAAAEVRVGLGSAGYPDVIVRISATCFIDAMTGL